MSRFGEALVASARDNSAGGRGLTTGEPDEPHRRTWGEVHERALRIAGALRPQVRPGDAVAVLAGDPGAVAPAVQAVWLLGGSVTMLQQPTPRTDLARWSGETLRALGVVEARLVLLGSPFEDAAEVLSDDRFPCRSVAELAEQSGTASQPLAEPVDRPADGPALLQLTSGATAEPKAVRITDANLHANIRAMASAVELDLDRDVLVAWLPLFHDMGMVGCLVLPMLTGMEAVLTTPADFLARPLLWPELISRHRGTVTVAPNFGYALLARRMSRAGAGAFDLSSLRIALNGAEPIDPAAVRSFTEAGAAFGLRADCVVCAFGMAESTLAVSLAPLRRGLEVDVVDGAALEGRGAAVPVSDEQRGREFARLGRPLEGIEVAVVDDSGRERGEREVGQLRIRGESVTGGYLTADGPVAARDELGWLSTGDDGYLVDGQVVICGRRKDVIILGGRNIYPTDVEYAACEVDGVRAGNAAAVRWEAGARRERFAVVVESRRAGADDAQVRKQVAARVFETVGFRPSAVVVLEPGSLPKTPSGKLKRAEAAQLVPDPEGSP